MKLQFLISIIIPIYNADKYLSDCIDSLLSQTYNNLEIILVDDGSTDNSGKICDDYAKKDKRIKVIHKQNGGVSSARNQGLDIAKGDYIAFVDPDDYVLPDMYKTLLRVIQNTNTDIVICGSTTTDIHGTTCKSYFPTNNNFVYSKFVDWFQDFIEYGNLQVVWNKLFKKNILIGHSFDTDLVRAEDVNFLLDVTKNNYHIALCPKVFYYYVKRKTSATRQYKIKYFESEYWVWKKLYEIGESLFLNNNINAIFHNISQKLIDRAYKLVLLIILLDNQNEYNARLEELKQLFKNNYNQIKAPKRIIQIWSYIFGKYPNCTIKILRLPLIKQLALYYITHR